MFSHPLVRQNHTSPIATLCFTLLLASRAIALDSFRSIDNRLPEPNHSYDMTNGPVYFGPVFTLYDLKFLPSNPSQLDFPTLSKGKWVFDSSFEINYSATIGIGLGPVHTITGSGKAHAVGAAPAGTNPQLFDTEMLGMDLYGLSSSTSSDIWFRESPTIHSVGVTTRDNLCPMCMSPVTYWRISSYFDVSGEVSLNGGSDWIAANKPIHLEQIADMVKEADYNGDGVVNAADYLLWRRGNGTMYNATDYNTWRAAFDAAVGSGNAALASGAVPEPCTYSMLTISAIALCRIGSRRWKSV